MRNSLQWSLLLTLILVGVSFAQGASSAITIASGDIVPAWVFYWVLGLVSAGATIWAAVTKILWDRGNKASTLTEDERGWLRQLYRWHKPVDDNQIPLWYIPRSWLDLLQNLREDHAAFKPLLIRLIEQNDGINADLRSQIKESLERHDQQQTKMLKLAVRVQRAVETLAGLEKLEIESALGDTDGETS